MSVERLEAAVLSGHDRIRHGFFTRRGGVSKGIYASLNCGYGSDDASDAVSENRARVAKAMGVAPESVLTVHQCHSDQARSVAAPWEPDKAPQADAMVTDRPGIALSILAADCAPVLLADVSAGVIGAAHAGWRGALHGILEAVIGTMHTLGARHERMVAAVGPCIAQPSYEVGAEFHEAFCLHDDGNERYFVPSDRDGHHRFDLAGYVHDRLAGHGLAQVEIMALDTYARPDDFFSYRRNTHEGVRDYGRQISCIALSGQP